MARPDGDFDGGHVEPPQAGHFQVADFVGSENLNKQQGLPLGIEKNNIGADEQRFAGLDPVAWEVFCLDVFGEADLALLVLKNAQLRPGAMRFDNVGGFDEGQRLAVVVIGRGQRVEVRHPYLFETLQNALGDFVTVGFVGPNAEHFLFAEAGKVLEMGLVAPALHVRRHSGPAAGAVIAISATDGVGNVDFVSVLVVRYVALN